MRHLPSTTTAGISAFVATGTRARLLGLAYLDAAAAAPLLIPRCSSVHTFGMRFDLDLYWLDEGGEVIQLRRAVPPRRLANCRGATAVLEVPIIKGGEISPPGP